MAGERGRLPATLETLVVASGEVVEERRLGLVGERDSVTCPDTGEYSGGLPSRIVEGGLGEAPERELAHPPPHAGLDDERSHA